MTVWTEVSMRELYHGLYDGPHGTPPPSNEGAIFLGIKNISDDGHLRLDDVRRIADEDFPKWTKRVVPQRGDIVFTYEATLNRYAIVPEGFHGCLGRRVALLRPNNERVDTKFLFYSFFGPMWRKTVSERTLVGATVDRIPIGKFGEFPIKVPSLPIQKRIAGILSAYDDLIAVNERRVTILEEMARRLFEDAVIASIGALPEPTAISVNITQSKGWQFRPLGDVAEVSAGQSPQSKHYNKDGTGLPFHQGVADFDGYFHKNRVYCNLSNGVRYADVGDILFSVRAPVGRIALALNHMIIGRGIASIKATQVGQTYLLAYLRNVFSETDIMGNGAVYKAINQTELKSIPIAVPPGYKLGKIDALLAPLWSSIQTLYVLNTNLRATRDLLLPRLISGEIDVSEAPLPEAGAAE